MQLMDHRAVFTIGKHKVSLDESVAFSNWVQIHAWCKENLSAPYTWLYVTFYFKDADEAVKFSLTWGGS